jgi:hypothetical protein
MAIARILVTSILALLVTVISTHAESKRVITDDGDEYTVIVKGRNIRVEALTFTAVFSVPEGWQTSTCPPTDKGCVFAAQSLQADLALAFSIHRKSRGPIVAESPDGRHFRSYMATEPPFLLYGFPTARRVTPYGEYPDHLDRRLLLPVLEGERYCNFAFSAPSADALRTSRPTIQLILDSYDYLVPKAI